MEFLLPAEHLENIMPKRRKKTEKPALKKEQPGGSGNGKNKGVLSKSAICLNNPVIVLSIFFIVGFFIYSNTLKSEFVFDDRPNILKNPHIRLSQITLKDLKKAGFESPSRNRPVSNISFAANYYFHQYNVLGYHLVNLFIHIMVAFLLYRLFSITFLLACAPSAGYRISKSGNPFIHSSEIAFWAALIWFVYPVNTQSVTYIVQRMNGLSGLFYILSLLLYVKGRILHIEGFSKGRGLKEVQIKVLFYFISAFIAGVLAFFSKENSVTLPFFIFFYEWFFFQGLSRTWIMRQGVYIIGVFAVTVFLAVIYMGGHPVERILSGYAVRDFDVVQRVLTEFRVVIFYLCLFLFPHPSRLNLDHDFPLSQDFFNPATTILSFGAILALSIVAIYKAKNHRLLSFCILWFLGNLIIESSVIGLEVIFEHRIYLPAMFIPLIGVILLDTHIKKRWPKHVVFIVLAGVLALWTYERNNSWKDRIAIWDDCVKKSSEKARPYNNLGDALNERGRFDEAVFYCRRALQIKPGSSFAHNNLGNALKGQGRFKDAAVHFKKALTIKSGFVEAHNNLGVALKEQGQLKDAIDQYNRALNLSPDYADAHNNLGVALYEMGKLAEAEMHCKKAIRLAPDSAPGYYNLGNVLYAQKKVEEAICRYKEALSVDPELEPAHANLGIVLYRQGKTAEAAVHFREVSKKKEIFRKPPAIPPLESQ